MLGFERIQYYKRKLEKYIKNIIQRRLKELGSNVDMNFKNSKVHLRLLIINS